jgi:hypothetical protein
MFGESLPGHDPGHDPDMIRGGHRSDAEPACAAQPHAQAADCILDPAPDARMQQPLVTLSGVLVFQSLGSLICRRRADMGLLARGHMDDRIGRRIANAAVTRAAAPRISGSIPHFAPEVESGLQAASSCRRHGRRQGSNVGAVCRFAGRYEREKSGANRCRAEQKVHPGVHRHCNEFRTRQAGEHAAGGIVGAVPGLGRFV